MEEGKEMENDKGRRKWKEKVEEGIQEEEDEHVRSGGEGSKSRGGDKEGIW